MLRLVIVRTGVSMRHYAISAAIVSLAWVADAAVPCTNHVALGQGATSTAPAQSADDAGALPVPQGWEAGEIRWWYHVSQGTALMPYDWFIALEQPPLPLEQPQPGTIWWGCFRLEAAA